MKVLHETPRVAVTVTLAPILSLNPVFCVQGDQCGEGQGHDLRRVVLNPRVASPGLRCTMYHVLCAMYPIPYTLNPRVASPGLYRAV